MKYNKATVTKMPVEGEIAAWKITNAKIRGVLEEGEAKESQEGSMDPLQ